MCFERFADRMDLEEHIFQIHTTSEGQIVKQHATIHSSDKLNHSDRQEMNTENVFWGK